MEKIMGDTAGDAVTEDYVVWNDSYSVGFAPIDEQHKKLVIMTNALYRACMEGAVAADISFARTIKNAVDYAKNHFATEEDYMGRAKYPHLNAHIEQHSTFLSELVNLIKRFESGDTAPIDMAIFLKGWLINHIGVSDKQYAPYIAKLAGR